MAEAEFTMSLPARTENDADPAVADALRAAKTAMGMIPNMYANMANVPGLLQTYRTGYDAFRSDSGLSPVEQEVVFLTISRLNGCRYCVAAHSAVADISQVPEVVTAALRGGTPLADAKLQALTRFTTTMVESRGLPTRADATAFIEAGYTERHMLHVLLAIAVKTISNYSNHLFHTPLDAVFAHRAWED